METVENIVERKVDSGICEGGELNSIANSSPHPGSRGAEQREIVVVVLLLFVPMTHFLIPTCFSRTVQFSARINVWNRLKHDVCECEVAIDV